MWNGEKGKLKLMYTRESGRGRGVVLQKNLSSICVDLFREDVN